MEDAYQTACQSRRHFRRCPEKKAHETRYESVEITVQSHGFESQQNLEGNNSEQAGQEKKTHRKLDLSSLEELEESDMTDEEIRAKDAIVNGDSSVEYSA